MNTSACPRRFCFGGGRRHVHMFKPCELSHSPARLEAAMLKRKDSNLHRLPLFAPWNSWTTKIKRPKRVQVVSAPIAHHFFPQDDLCFRRLRPLPSGPLGGLFRCAVSRPSAVLGVAGASARHTTIPDLGIMQKLAGTKALLEEVIGPQLPILAS